MKIQLSGTAKKGAALGAVSVLSAALALVAVEPASHAAAAPRGADLPFSSVEAEDSAHATTNGTQVGPDYTQGTLASEASGRKAVQLSDQGQYVEFTVPSDSNAIDVVYNVPDGKSGSLSVYVNGTKLSQSLDLTSKYSYVDTSNITGSKTHHFFDDARLLLGQDVKAGDKVKLQVDSSDTAGPYTIDTANFENVPDATTAPSGAVSVVDKGADPTGQQDATQAFNDAIAAAKGGVVWIPKGDFKVDSALTNLSDVTLEGAGNWYSVVHSSHFIDQTNGSGGVNLKDFAVIGEVTERVDSEPDNFVNGSLGSNSSVSGMWIQHEKCGMWLMGTNDNLKVENNEIVDTTADGINLNGTAKGVEVSNNYLRNNGDDALAMWSLNAADTDDTFASNTISQPNLANGIALYGGTDLTVKDNLVSDTNALGSGIAISNQAFSQPFFPLSGTITVSGNTLVRTGALNPNWQHPMGALRVDSYDSAIDATVNISDTTFTDSPYSAFEFVSGGGQGLAVKNVKVDGAKIDGVGTVAVQAETQGSASFDNVTATGVGDAGVYNCPYPQGTADFTLTDGSGNSGWDSTWDDCSTWPQPKS